MSWQSIIGQKRITTQLQNIILNKQVAQAYCIYGGEGVGQDSIAIEFVRSLLCKDSPANSCGKCKNCEMISKFTHPNLYLLYSIPTPKNGKDSAKESEGNISQPEKIRKEIQKELQEKSLNPYYKMEIDGANSILIEQVRDLQKNFVSLSTYAEGNRFIIIFNADEMNEVSSNALLKVLEEPSTNTIFILTTSRIDGLLSTIISRCQLLRCDPLSIEEIKIALEREFNTPSQQALLLAKLANGSYSKAIELQSSDLEEERSNAMKTLEIIINSSLNEMISHISQVITEFDKNRITAKNHLLLIYYLLRDMLMLKEENPNLIINSDYISKLDIIKNKIQDNYCEAGMNQCEKSIEHLESYVYLPLVFYSFAIKLRRIFN
ncbi:MAG: hypothetical protein EXR24_02250 [Ignavibacteria bacterium]|nr:hypothetical protein [Ignavibacteria bacterium]